MSARRGPRHPGEVIDRSYGVTFTFNGQPVTAHRGDTIVSGLAASGIRAYAQGRRLQTRRGPLTADRFDPNCFLQVDDEPNVPAAHRLLVDGLAVRTQHVWPSLNFDLKSVNQRVARAFHSDREMSASTAGNFLRPAYRRLLSHVGVAGRLGGGPAIAGSVRHLHPDVLVAGAGLAGLAAAAAAAETGADVLVLEADHQPGGWWRSGAEDGSGAQDEVTEARRALLAAGGRLLVGAVVSGATPEGVVIVSVDGRNGDELIVCRAGHVILATGTVERSLTFTGNDLPGVMLSTGARRLARLWSVRPGERLLVISGNDHGESVAADCAAAGATVVDVLDARKGASIRSASGTTELESVVLGDGTTVEADALVAAPGWTVDAALVRSAGGRVRVDRTSGRAVAEGRPGLLSVVGMLAGEGTLDAVVAHAQATGRQAAASAARRRVTRGGATGLPRTDVRRVAPPQLPLDGETDELQLASVSVGIVDFHEDVTAYELSDTDAVGATRRLLQAGAAPGSDARARAELAELARHHPAVAELSLPLLTGSIGAVAPLIGGVRLGALAQLRPRVVRRTALAQVHEDAGAHLAPAGRGWIDVVDHGDPEAERRALRIGAAVVDSGRCGLFRLDGAGAPRLLASVLSRPVVLDVGSVAAITSSALTAAVLVARVGELTWLARTEPVDTDAFDEGLVAETAGERRAAVHVALLTEGLAGILFAGPRAGSCVTELLGQAPGVDRVVLFDAEVGAEGGFAWCVEEDGRVVYELRVPAGRAVAVWRAAVAAAWAHQGRPVGVVAWAEQRANRVVDEVVHV